jgi:site-specific DNA-methyltransferase (adenine-specific)
MRIIKVAPGFMFIHGDRTEVAKLYPPNYFDIAIDDPPYFSGPEKKKYYGNPVSSQGVNRAKYKQLDIKNWQVPPDKYFDKIIEISKQQIIWGVNYFDYSFGPGRIVWDKVNGATSFSDAEIAYCSFHDSVRIFAFMWNGMCQGVSYKNGRTMQGNKKLNEKRIHQCQKPIALYQWTYEKYAAPGQRIFDGHLGSASNAIAAYYAGIAEFVGVELDGDLIEEAAHRFRTHIAKFPIGPSAGALQKTIYDE